MPVSAFMTAVQPNFDSGFAVIPTVEAAVPNASDSTVYMLGGIRIWNAGGVARTVTVKNGAGTRIAPDAFLPAGANVLVTIGEQEPVTGLRWVADGAGCSGHAWGWQ